MATLYYGVSDPNFSTGDNIVVEVPLELVATPAASDNETDPTNTSAFPMTTVQRLINPNAVSSVDVLLHLTTDTADNHHLK